MNRLVKWKIFYGLGLLGFAAGIYLAIAESMWIWFVLSLIYCKAITILGGYVGHHRYFTHSSFKTTPRKHKLLCWLSFLSAIGSPVDWFINHNHHHINSDRENDLHSPKSGIWTSMLWNLRSEQFFHDKQVNIFPKSLYKDRTVRFIHKNYFLLWFALGLVMTLISWKLLVFFVLMPIGVNNLLITFVGIIMHVKLPGSYRNYDAGDLSYNNKFLSKILLVEGYHNNHHAHPTKYYHGMQPGEFDITGEIIKKFFIPRDMKNS